MRIADDERRCIGPQPPCARRGLRRREAACSVGAPGRSWSYARGAPPCIRSRGARNATRCASSTAF